MTWHTVDGALHKEWVFPDFKTAWAFAEAIAALAEEAQHHPEITVGWGRVVVGGLCTHDAGGAITEKDHDLARRIDALSPHYVS
jgi:4a-hydroxytetrahydrobiopterin dehydratase